MSDTANIAAAAWTSITLVDFLVGIAGNWIARHADPLESALAATIRERFSKSTKELPPNHDVVNACRASLRQALQMLAQAVALRVDRPKTWLEGFRNNRDERGHWKPFLSRMQTAQGMWFDEFVREIQSDEALDQFRVPVGDASSLNMSVRNLPDEELATLFHETLLDWIERRVQTGIRPACVEEFIRDGWPIDPETPGVRIALYQAWCLFLQDQIKHHEQVFRILTVDWLATIDSKLQAVSFSRDDLLNAVQGPLGEQRERLIGLHDEVTKLLDVVGGLSLTVGELLPLVIEFRDEVGEHFQVMRSELVTIRDQLRLIEATSEATKAIVTRSDQRLDQSLQNDEAILRELTRQSAAVPPISHPAPHQLPPTTTAGMHYGRKKQCNDLEAALRARKSVAVLGPAGYGKTALAAKVVEAVVGTTTQSLAASQYPDGVLFLNLYAYRGHADSVWSSMADALAGSDFRPSELARERATEACRGKRILVILEGGEEADGTEGRTILADLTSVLSSENRQLLLTRNKLQTMAGATISVEDPLSEREAGQLFDKLTDKRVKGSIRERVLTLLLGHPLAITWAGGLLAREDENPTILADEWEADSTRTLNDPVKSHHTLEWLFGRSVRGLDESARLALNAAGLLAPVLFKDEVIAAAIGSDSRQPLKQLIDRGLLRRDRDRPELCEFTHALSYQFARDEKSSDAGLRSRLAAWQHQRLSALLAVGVASTDELPDLLQHAAALLRADHDQQLWKPLGDFLLYELNAFRSRFAKLASIEVLLDSIADWFHRLPTDVAESPTWLREWAACLNHLGRNASKMGRYSDAKKLLCDSFGIMKRLADLEPLVAARQKDLANALSALGQCAIDVEDFLFASKCFTNCLDIRQTLVDLEPDNAEWNRALAQSICWRGYVSELNGDLDAARNDYRRFHSMLVELRKSAGWQIEWNRDLAVSLGRQAQIEITDGNLKTAEQFLNESFLITQRLAEEDRANADWQHGLSVCLYSLAKVYIDQQRLSKALEFLEQCCDIDERLVSLDPDNTTWYSCFLASKRLLEELNNTNDST